MKLTKIAPYIVALLVGLIAGLVGGFGLFGGNAQLPGQVAQAVVEAQRPGNQQILAAVTADIDPAYVTQLEASTQAQTIQIEELSSALDQAVTAQRTAETAIKNNSETLDRLIAERNRLKSALDVATAEVSQLQQANAQQAETLNTAQTEAVAQLEELTAERDALTAQIEAAAGSQDEIARYEEQLRRMISAREEDSRVLGEVNQRALVAEQEVERLSGLLEQTGAQAAVIETLTSERNQLAVRVEELHSSIEAEKSAAAIVQERLETLTANASQQQQRSQTATLALQAKVAQLEEVIANTPPPIDPAVVVERDSLIEQIAEVRSAQQALEVDRDALSSEVQRLGNIERELKARYNNVVNEYNSLANLYNQLLEQARAQGN